MELLSGLLSILSSGKNQADTAASAVNDPGLGAMAPGQTPMPDKKKAGGGLFEQLIGAIGL